MRSRLGGSVLVLGLLVAGADLRAQLQLAVEWRLPPAGLTFGEPFVVEVVRRWPADAEPEPFDPAALAPLVVVLLDVEALASGERRRYRAWPFVAGELELPPVTLRARQRDGRVVSTTHTPRPLLVRSLLPEPAGEIEWPEAFAARRPFAVLPWLVAAIAALFGGIVWWQRRRALPAPAVAPVAAPSSAAVARAALRALSPPSANAAPADVQAFYRQLATIVREHAGRALAVPPATRTSEELVAATVAGTAPLRACLQRCDGVKFAAQRPDSGAHAEARQAALAFVEAEPT